MAITYTSCDYKWLRPIPLSTCETFESTSLYLMEYNGIWGMVFEGQIAVVADSAALALSICPSTLINLYRTPERGSFRVEVEDIQLLSEQWRS